MGALQRVAVCKSSVGPLLRTGAAHLSDCTSSYSVEDWEDPKRRPRLPLKSDELETIIYKFGWQEILAHEYPGEVSRAENVTTVLHANVLEIETNPDGDRINRLRVAAPHGEQFFVTAKRYILAAGGIEIPRLLLASNRIQKNGLGNHHDLVGRFFMEHIHFWSGILVPNRPEVLQTTALYNEIHTVSGVPIIGKLALPETVIRREKLLNQNVQLMPILLPNPFKFPTMSAPAVRSLRTVFTGLFRGEKIDNLGRHLAQALRSWDEIAIAIGRKMRRKLAKVPQIQLFRFANMAEQAPNPLGRVTLGSEQDQFGQRRVRLDWRVTAEDIRSIRRHRISWRRHWRAQDSGVFIRNSLTILHRQRPMAVITTWAPPECIPTRGMASSIPTAKCTALRISLSRGPRSSQPAVTQIRS